MLLIGADKRHYGSLNNQLQQNMAMGTNNCIESVDETINILNTFAKMSKCNRNQRKGATEVAFTQKEAKRIVDHIKRVCAKKDKVKEEAKVHTQLDATSNENEKEEEGDELGYDYHQNTIDCIDALRCFIYK